MRQAGLRWWFVVDSKVVVDSSPFSVNDFVVLNYPRIGIVYVAVSFPVLSSLV
jgi:hypothetical protein